MHGKWKEQLGGYDRKGQKRRRQTAHNTFKDKGASLFKIYDGYYRIRNGVNKPHDESFRVEGQIEYTSEPRTRFKNSGFVETWHVEVSRFTGYITLGSGYEWETLSYSLRTAYFNDVWKDRYTNEPIDSEVKKITLLYTEEVQYDVPKAIPLCNSRWSYKPDTNELPFVYNRPVYDWYRMTLYNDGKRRKYAQNRASRRDRTAIRDWLSQGDWDKEIKTHALSKSIAWDI